MNLIIITLTFNIKCISFSQGFFKRSTMRGEKYKCFFGGQCEITPQNRNRCKSCRFRLCLESGMSLEGKKSYSTTILIMFFCQFYIHNLLFIIVVLMHYLSLIEQILYVIFHDLFQLSPLSNMFKTLFNLKLMVHQVLFIILIYPNNKVMRIMLFDFIEI